MEEFNGQIISSIYEAINKTEDNLVVKYRTMKWPDAMR
jgi:hypothetical protein